MVKVSNICTVALNTRDKMFTQTIVSYFQRPNTPYRAGMSLSLEVVITSSNSEISLRSNVSWYDTGAESVLHGNGKDTENVVVNVHGHTDVYLELGLQSNGGHLVQLFGNILLLVARYFL